jgi:hypothetical protein
MKYLILCSVIMNLFLVGCAVQKNASTTEVNAEQQLRQLSKDKWIWMSEKNVEKLENLFHDKAKFVHMSGTWKKKEELDIIKTGSIWYKKAEVFDVALEIEDDVAILWNRIKLTAVVRGSDAINEFTVTEVYKRWGNNWKMMAMTFSSVRDTHKIQH